MEETHWALLVTDGTVVEYPPEIYRSRTRAVQEARRWAWLLSANGETRVRKLFGGRWQAGFRDIRLVDIPAEPWSSNELWVGTYWAPDGYPDPEAVVLRGRRPAIDWCSAPVSNTLAPTRIEETEWSVAATFLIRGEEAYAVAHLAKVVAG